MFSIYNLYIIYNLGIIITEARVCFRSRPLRGRPMVGCVIYREVRVRVRVRVKVK
jgi:hypothetical protein